MKRTWEIIKSGTSKTGTVEATLWTTGNNAFKVDWEEYKDNADPMKVTALGKKKWNDLNAHKHSEKFFLNLLGG